MHEAAIKAERGDYFGAVMALAPGGMSKISEEAYYYAKGGKSMFDDLKSWFTGGSDEAELAKEAGITKAMVGSLNPAGGFGSSISVGTPVGEYLPEMARGGLLANSPIKRVNDMILTKDGEMIQTASDDNIIAKKGGITQKTGGGSSRVEQLLEGILHAVQESGDTYIDGAKVSAAINSANYRA